MVIVELYGHLAKLYGKRHVLDINSPAEAIRAFCANHKGFKQAIMQHDQPGYRVIAGTEDRAFDIGMQLPVGSSRLLKIIPVVTGSGGGFGRILLGAALIGASFFLPGTSIGLTEMGLFATSALSSVGFSLVIGGVSSLLFSPSKPSSTGSERPENKPSYNFNGPVNTVGQGNCVPVGYGRMRIGSQVASAGTETVNL
jgi:predicted phage tail protein